MASIRSMSRDPSQKPIDAGKAIKEMDQTKEEFVVIRVSARSVRIAIMVMSPESDGGVPATSVASHNDLVVSNFALRERTRRLEGV